MQHQADLYAFRASVRGHRIGCRMAGWRPCGLTVTLEKKSFEVSDTLTQGTFWRKNFFKFDLKRHKKLYLR